LGENIREKEGWMKGEEEWELEGEGRDRVREGRGSRD